MASQFSAAMLLRVLFVFSGRWVITSTFIAIDLKSYYVRENYDLTPKGIIGSLHLLDVDYNKVSAYGHFTRGDMPWEM